MRRRWAQWGPEDPFVYVDQGGVLHAVFHSQLIDDDERVCGAHAFSENGLDWTMTGTAWGNVVDFIDGGRYEFSRRERPHLVFGADGVTPVAISTGFRDGPGDHTFTLVQETELSQEEMERLY